MIMYHYIAFFIGFIIDLILGDPYWLPHPIRLIGNLIAALDIKLNKGNNLIFKGFILVIIVLVLTFLVTILLLLAAYRINDVLGCALESIMTYQILATKCLKTESMKVYNELMKNDIEGARKAVSMIVGRDTAVLDGTGITKAAVETVAENTSDGVIAPMIYLAIGGPVIGFLYKAINTMDSMIGYKNDKYLYFGRAAAKLDDIVNYIPSRISAVIMILSCFFGGKDLDGKNAYRIYTRDNRKHSSPNSAQTEAACAGALHIRLAGDAWYFGKLVKKQYIGDNDRTVEYEDIKRANKLLYLTAFICEIICMLIMILLA